MNNSGKYERTEECPFKVLLVEDETHIRTVIEYNLRRDGFEVFEAEDGSDAVRLVQEIKPDLVLLDWMMPDRSGLEILAELKRSAGTKHIPIVMLTARGDESDIQRAGEVGAAAYITKPFAPRKLSPIIRKVLQEHMQTAGT